MSKSLTAAVALAAVFAVSSAAFPVRAADPDFCRDYARAAVNQYRQAEDSHRCMDRIRDFSRWSDDWRRHYDWCIGVSRDWASSERRARQEVLLDCTRHDWDRDRYDHERYDHGRYDHDRYDH